MSSGPNRLLRWIASRMVRGPHAPFVLGDLAESMQHDLEGGMSLARAGACYLRNAVTSGLLLARARVVGRTQSLQSVGLSWLDVKLGLRMLVKHPLLTAVSVVSLGVGIPVGLVPGLILDAAEAPPPFEQGERIQVLRSRSLETTGAVTPTSYDLAVWRDALESFEMLAGVRLVEHSLDPAPGVPTAVVAAEVTGSAFAMLHVRPLMGRTLDPADVALGAPPVVVIGEDLWRARLAGDPEVVGRTVRIDGGPHTIVGVMPSGFGFPVRQQMWLPFRDPSAGAPGGVPPCMAPQGAEGVTPLVLQCGWTRLSVYGRLVEGVTTEAAETELGVVLQRQALDFPDQYRRRTAEVAPASVAGRLGAPLGRMRGLPQVWLLQALGLVLLLVACVNVGLLVFARAAMRSSELAVRTALGASRTRIVAQVFTEALVLAVLSAGLGVLGLHVVTTRYFETLRSAIGANVPYWFDVGVTSQTLVQAIVLAMLGAGVAAIVPALRVTGRTIHRNLQRVGTGGGIRFGRLSTALVVADVAVAVAIVGVAVGIGDRIGGLVRPDVVPGFPAEEYLAAQVRLPLGIIDPFESDSAAAAHEERMAVLEQELVERLDAEPGVRGVAVGAALPGMGHVRRIVEVEAERHPIDRSWVGLGFFEGLGKPVLAGRDFNRGDLEGERPAVLVNTAFMERVLGGANPLGKRVRYPTDGPDARWFEIIGVAPDLGMDPLNPRGGAGVYHPVAPGELARAWLAIHLRQDPISFAPRLRTLLAEVDPVAILEQPMRLDRAALLEPERGLGMAVTAGAALLAMILLALAASGIYAIMAFAVARRTHEIGVRRALGAGRGEIAAAIGRRAALQLAVGVLIGMPVAGRLYYMIQEDPAATGASVVAAVVPGIGVMLLLGLVACSGPLTRALRVPPTEAMTGDA